MRRFIFIYLLLAVNILPAFALDIVYPSKADVTINADSAFVFGNVRNNSSLTINNEPVKIWDEGIFVHVIPLNYGKNSINFTETLPNGSNNKKTYIITRNMPSSKSGSTKAFLPKPEGKYLYAKTINDFSTVRQKPTIHSNRVTELPKDTVLYLSGVQGDFYKIDESYNTELWIHKSNLTQPVEVTRKFNAKIKKPKETSDKYYNCVKIPVSHPVLYTLKQEGNTIKATLFGIENDGNNEIKNNNFEFVKEINGIILGYDAVYEDNKFILRMAKVPQTSETKPLNGVRIYIDAGHGGTDNGATGPTRVVEKEINLAIAKRLITLLKQSGAEVSYTRVDDKFVQLYERAENASKNNNFISISIHNNSLPPGKNPYSFHGTETHYYNQNAKKLAEIITNNISQDLGIKNNGIHKSSFVMDRITNPVSVLVEVAYMINPEEYLKIKNKRYQLKAAQSIKRSIEEYIISIKKQNNCDIISN